VDDLVEGRIRMMNTDDSFTGPVNIGNPDEFTMLGLAELILKLTNSKSKIIHLPLPQDDPLQRKPNIKLAQQILNNWKPKIKLETGLNKTINYFKKME
jgi:UDP-glucuronate decarboxylase